MATTSANARPSPRPRGRALRRARALPLLLALGCAGAAAAVWFVLRARAARQVTIVFERDGAELPALDLTFFPDRLAFAAPSPPPPIGELRLDGADSVTVERALVPDRAVVRYRGDGIGTGYTHVQLGRARPPIELRAPVSFAGRVGEPLAFWCFGWRCAGLEPVAGAEVVVMGGGEHGVPLAVASTDADGRFVVDGIDGALDGLGLRVKAQGFAIAHQRLGRVRAEERNYPVVALARARACAGRIAAPPEVDVTRLRVLARGLPGVQTVPTADGHFVLDHVPLGVVPRLMLDGLGPTWAHEPAHATIGKLVRIDVVPGAIVRGRVLDATSGEPLGDALVWCGELGAVRTDERGRYELLRQLPGPVEIEAKWELVEGPRRRTSFTGRTAVVLEAAREHDGVDVRIPTTHPR